MKELIAPLLAYKMEHGDFNLLISVKGNELQMSISSDSNKHLLIIDLVKSGYSDGNGAGFGKFMEMLSNERKRGK